MGYYFGWHPDDHYFHSLQPLPWDIAGAHQNTNTARRGDRGSIERKIYRRFFGDRARLWQQCFKSSKVFDGNVQETQFALMKKAGHQLLSIFPYTKQPPYPTAVTIMQADGSHTVHIANCTNLPGYLSAITSMKVDIKNSD